MGHLILICFPVTFLQFAARFHQGGPFHLYWMKTCHNNQFERTRLQKVALQNKNEPCSFKSCFQLFIANTSKFYFNLSALFVPKILDTIAQNCLEVWLPFSDQQLLSYFLKTLLAIFSCCQTTTLSLFFYHATAHSNSPPHLANSS